MSERYGYGYRDEPSDSDLPASRRGAVTQRREDDEPDDADVHEIDLTEDRDRDGRADAEEGDRPGDQAAQETDAETAQFTPVDGDSDAAGTAPPPRSAYGDADDEERDPGSPDDYPPGAGDVDVAPSAELVDAEGPGVDEAGGTSRADVLDEDSAWARPAGADQAVAERGDDLATPGPDSATGSGSSDLLAPAAATDAASAPPAAATALLASVDAEAVRRQFLDLQAGFVDEPRQAVQRAGELVDDLVRQVTQALLVERDRLQGNVGADEASTEDLRLAMRAYRAYVDRLLGLTI